MMRMDNGWILAPAVVLPVPVWVCCSLTAGGREQLATIVGAIAWWRTSEKLIMKQKDRCRTTARHLLACLLSFNRA